MAMVSIELSDGNVHEYAERAGEVILNVHGKRSGAVAALVNGEQRDFSHIIESDCK